jgi:hypothetical protein
MQTDPCHLCLNPALERYAVVRADLAAMTEERLVVPLCEPHRRWLEEAGRRGRPDGRGGVLRLATAGACE